MTINGVEVETKESIHIAVNGTVTIGSDPDHKNQLKQANWQYQGLGQAVLSSQNYEKIGGLAENAYRNNVSAL